MPTTARARAAESLVAALDRDRPEHAVHALLSLLGDANEGTQQRRRLERLARIVTRLWDLQRHGPMELRPGLADEFDTTNTANTADEQDHIQDQGVSYCLSYPQLQMYTLQAMNRSSTAYNITRAVRYNDHDHGALDLSALRWACAAIVIMHEVLRTRFHVTPDGEPRQRVRPVDDDGGRLLQHLTIRGFALADTKRLGSFLADATRGPFDLHEDAPIRVYAATSPQSPGEWVLVTVAHHIVTDPESSGVLWADLVAFYDQFRAMKGDDVAAVASLRTLAAKCSAQSTRISYRDFALWQRRRFESGLLTNSLQYWIQELQGELPVLELPVDRRRAPLTMDTDADQPGDRRGGTVLFRSSAQLREALITLCAAHGATPFMGLLAIFHLLLSRLSGAEDIVIGSPVSGRNHDGLEGLMGYFVNTLPFRLRPSTTTTPATATFAAFLAYVRGVIVQGFAHMDVPLQLMLEHISVARGGVNQDSPVFQVMFAWEDGRSTAAGTDDDDDDSDDDVIDLPHETAKFDLMLSMREVRADNGERVLEGTFEYPTEDFERATIERFGRYFLELLANVTATPDASLSEINMVPKDERRRLLCEWGPPPMETSSATSSPAFLDELVLGQVQRTPDHPALYFEDEVWTYRDLWDRALAVAVALRAARVPVGSRVGLFLDRGLGMVAAILGVLRVRAVFIPLDPAFPHERIAYMLEDSQARVVLTQTHLRQTLEGILLTTATIRNTDPRNDDDNNDHHHHTQKSTCAVLVLVIDGKDKEEDAASSPAAVAIATVEDDIGAGACKGDGRPDETMAYILYTSGSTGRPKGVMVSHANLLTTVRWTVREYAVNGDDRFLQSTSSTLDGSLTQLFSPLVTGAGVVITKPNGLHDLGYMASLLTSRRITYCVFVPSYFAMLLDALDEFPGHVKHVVLAGEAFPAALAQRFYRRHGRWCPATRRWTCSTCLVNEYGPTEASVTSTFARFPCERAMEGAAEDEHVQDDAEQQQQQQQQRRRQRQQLDQPQGVPIGRGIDDHFVVVLDKHRRLSPTNVPGELYVGGRGVALGYWNRPALTATSFSELPPSLTRWLEQSPRQHHPTTTTTTTRAPCRWYKTGDLVKWLPTGELAFLGRTDAQVKLRGMRIELQEVRHVLLRRSSVVRDAEVLVAEDRLVAYVLLQAAAAATSALADLREHLRWHLPAHMVPQELCAVAAWPRTPNGKLDLRALAAIKRNSTRMDSCVEASGGTDHDGPGATPTTSHVLTLGSRIGLDVLTQAWREVLGIDDDDDKLLQSASFFELGGNSLSAIRVISLVRPHGLDLGLDAFFRCRNLIEMAHACGTSIDSRALSQRTLVPLNWKSPRASTTPPLFLVHCADGTIWKLLELGRLLPMPVIGLQATHRGTISTVEALARTYWDEIRAFQPRGPYHIGGFSFGCRVAHAIAVLATEDGAEVAPLTLVDGVPFGLDDEGQDQVVVDELSVGRYIAEAFGLHHVDHHQQQRQQERAQGKQTQEEEEEDEDDDDAGKDNQRQPQDGDGVTDDRRGDSAEGLYRHIVRHYAAHCNMDRRYRPASPPSPSIAATLYKTRHWNVDVAAYAAAGVELELVPVPGRHLTMLQPPQVSVLAGAITAAAQAAHAHVE